MPRYRLLIEYVGTAFFGWQRQADCITVQGAIEQAFKNFCGEEVTLFCAGRTDTGVHARGQVAHVDLVKEWPAFRILQALNHYLRGQQVAILDVEQVGEEFHARYSAQRRAYEYVILNRRAPLTLEADRAWYVPQPLNLDTMREAAQHLIGLHDFSTFRAAGCQSNGPVKTLDLLDIHREGERIIFKVEARSFLYHQVRNMVGSLEYVGRGKWTVEDFIRARNACDRRAGGPSAPAHGLYFMRVDY
jgi:tRNA pseudouridine38-40 synthase